MSHYRLKAKYKHDTGAGWEEDKVLYIHHNLSCDIITFYDENGDYIFSFDSTTKNNMLDIMVKAATPFDADSRELLPGIEHANFEEWKNKVES